jgi:hypothetical protein
LDGSNGTGNSRSPPPGRRIAIRFLRADRDQRDSEPIKPGRDHA